MRKQGLVVSIVAFFAIMFSVLVVAFLLMSVVNTILEPVGQQVGNVSAQAGSSIGEINTSFSKWWDIFIVMFFFLNVIILMISAFLVDIHPVFLIIYVLSAFFLMVFGGNAVDAMGVIWSDTGSFTNAVSDMPLTLWLLNHFTLVILSIIVISGIVMYSKFKFGSGGGAY